MKKPIPKKIDHAKRAQADYKKILQGKDLRIKHDHDFEFMASAAHALYLKAKKEKLSSREAELKERLDTILPATFILKEECLDWEEEEFNSRK